MQLSYFELKVIIKNNQKTLQRKREYFFSYYLHFNWYNVKSNWNSKNKRLKGNFFERLFILNAEFNSILKKFKYFIQRIIPF